ncbi:GDSL esterase/lipase [Hibiscus syriacus]|uniref:GDSL esterase/lipase n=1 Tax=Hibiscus syriacus TaxID=106335 RepID=A0A6A3BF76_HIBSY|nr:GDSL esterase/lipase At1g28570-like [Hibiscus syriacus]KAE8713682.1 GDSL esterase/lipase [Hibiscus syriacus]
MGYSSSFCLLKRHLIISFIFSISITLISHVNGCFTSIFSFGDSLADTGNLLQLSLSESRKLSHFDFLPYGRTFFNNPTGRCSDGRLVIDFIAEEFGLPFLPPYFEGKNGRGKHFQKGVNFAVVGATALDDAFFKERGIRNPFTNISLGDELGFFKDVLHSLCSSSSDCKELLQNSLIVMGEIGGNDYNHAFLQGINPKEMSHFVPLVVHTIAEAITELIELGAVTMLVPGNLPIGCSPAYLTYFQGSDIADYDPHTGCITWLNQFSQLHNELLQKQLNRIRELHPHVNIVYADYYNTVMRFYYSQNQFGFTETLKACCGGGGRYNYSSSMACGDPPLTTCCDDPSLHVNWDGLHYTEATYKWISKVVLQELYAIPFINTF